MKTSSLRILLLWFAVIFSGCAELPTVHHREAPLSERFRAMALEYESQGDLNRALLNWQVVKRLEPKDERASQRIAHLTTEIEKMAEIYFNRAMESYDKGLYERAQKLFLITLRYDPGHQKALYYLKSIPPSSGFMTYKVKGGETLKDIALEIYKDPNKDFLVAYFMGLDIGGKPKPGTVFELPVLDVGLVFKTEPAVGWSIEETKIKLFEANDLFGDKDYEKVLEIVNEILEYDLKNKEAEDLANAAYFHLGKKYKLQRKYSESLNMFGRVDPGYVGIQEWISALRKDMIKQGKLHYRRGVKYFVNEDLEKAIVEWEKALVMDPEHERAKEDLKRARELLDKLNRIQ